MDEAAIVQALKGLPPTQEARARVAEWLRGFPTDPNPSGISDSQSKEPEMEGSQSSGSSVRHPDQGDCRLGLTAS